MTKPMRVLVIGASGMLGHIVLRLFAESTGYEVWGTTRGAPPQGLTDSAFDTIGGIDLTNWESVMGAFLACRPDVTINCAGVVKQLAEADDPLTVLPLNSLVPHRLARLCELTGSRFIHVSTDCVFDGQRGGYIETDLPNARDLYGASKYLGEVSSPGCVTLRTSIIGPQLDGTTGLVSWFLSQHDAVHGYTRAIFSGLSTLELARVMRDYVIPSRDLEGVYHVSTAPISKYDLLLLLAEAYQKPIDIVPDDRLKIDRSLDSTRFRNKTGYVPPAWREMVREMRLFG
jgi:dTDP-4-dehydrorhamnose reductase